MINLLPPEEKKILQIEENWKLVLILGSLILIFLICLILILFSIKFSISGKVQSQKIIIEMEEKDFKKAETQDFREKIISINKNLSKLNSFYQEQVPLTEILEKISELLTPEVYLTSLSYQKETSKISLSGFAQTRETLFELKKNLEREFKEVYFPPQSWIKPTDIDFQATFKITK